MDNSTGALIGIGLAQLAALLTIWLKNSAAERRERDRLAAEAEKETRHRQWLLEDRRLLEANTKISTEAFAEAAKAREEGNHLNEKLATLTAMLAHTADRVSAGAADGETLNRVDETTQETLERVKQAEP
jgi:hypothetical protein